ncbi:uncharacterized protein N7518_009402 [Penicillium psychrosexuale]|uniref:uncharacterized protein n=1 Tax=Penicillium psychrosexuale TaxID=1002107 RepID=UPI002545267F|nr:uncharacterized protein N7518_009402 [Penicillium psychrosexuale]KAJ5783725.1 hypothetical protein N7518_009402 [Penicillium psychrosexuale]
MNSTILSDQTPSCGKILMLHGHSQSGQFFQCKTRFIRQYMERSVLKTLQSTASRSRKLAQRRRQAGLRTEHIKGLEKSIQCVSDILERHGPFIGIIGFSSGADVAAIVTSVLEKKVSICNFNITRDHPPMKLAFCLSGFQLAHPAYAPIYYQ